MSGSRAPDWKDLDHGGYQRRHWLRRKVGKALVKQAIKSIATTGRIWGTAAAGQKLGRIFNTPNKNPAKRMKFAPKTRRRRGAQVSKKKKRGRVSRDGVHTVRKKHKRTRHKVKSLKKRVVALEGKQPLRSKFWNIEYKTIAIREDAICAVRWYNVPLAEKATTQTVTAVLTGAEAGVRCKVDNVRTQFDMRNGSTANVCIEYQIYRCVGNTSQGILDDLKGMLGKKGVAITTTVDPEVAHTGTSSMIPEQLRLTGLETWSPLWNVNRDSVDWKPVGTIEKAVIGPGDTLTVKHNTGKFVFDVDDVAEADAGTKYWRNLDYRLVMRVVGAIGHDSGLNEMNIGYSGWVIDSQWSQSTRVAHVNGQGTDQILLTTLDNGQNITDIDFADNQVSAIAPMVD